MAERGSTWDPDALLSTAARCVTAVRRGDGPRFLQVDTDRLMADIARYETFGIHRYGLESADATLDWIASELTLAGLRVTEQRFQMDRQYVLKSGTLRVGSRLIDVVPQWWPPEDPTSFDLSAPIWPRSDNRAAKLRSSALCCRSPTAK